MTASSAPPCRPVVLGVDIGVYAIARAFHERYGVRSTVVARGPAGPVADSRIIDLVSVGEGSQRQDVVDTLLRIGREHTGAEPLVLLFNSDSWANLVTDNEAALAEHYLFPRLSRELLDQVATKASFHELCAAAGIKNPRTVVQDFSGADADDWAPASVDIPFPWVAKPSAGATYENMRFEGKHKIWFLPDQAAADRLYTTLRREGFRHEFLIQELIPGDDTHMRWASAYVDSRGTVTMLAAAQVLLEEHSPIARGNPAAMISGAEPELMDAVEHLLSTIPGYHGFANFDVKRDPRDGSFVFFELNPRIGRSNYCATAAGTNIAEFFVDDIVHGIAREPRRAEREVLYTVLPVSLVKHYLVDPALRRRVGALARTALVHPLLYPFERTNLRRRLYVFLNAVNQRKKYRQHYPDPTPNSF